MIDKVKKHLKTLSKAEIKQIIEHPDLTELERWIIYYTFAEKRMVINTCYKLSISERQFFIIKDKGLIKLYYILGLNKTVQF
jgi:hypothetical protein